MLNIKRQTKAVKNIALQGGADLVGIGSIERYENAPELVNPKHYLPEAKSVIVAAIRYPLATYVVGSVLAEAGPMMAMARKLDMIALDITRYLEDLGWLTWPVDQSGSTSWRVVPYEKNPPFTAAISHRHMAVGAGLGEFGLSGLFLSPEFGPRQRLVSIVTTAPLIPNPMYEGKRLCDNCHRCIRACGMQSHTREVEVAIGGKTYKYRDVDKLRCAWVEQFGLSTADGIDQYGLTRENIKVPDVVTEESIIDAMTKKDHPSQHTTTVSPCIKVCAEQFEKRRRKQVVGGS